MADDQCAEDTNEQAEETSTDEFITVDSVMENDVEEVVDEQENEVVEIGASEDASKLEDSTKKDGVCQRWIQKICHMGASCERLHPTERLDTCAQFRWGECPRTDCTKLHFSANEEFQFYKTGALPVHKGDAKETGSKCESLPASHRNRRKKDTKKDLKFVCKAWLDDDSCLDKDKCESQHPKERLVSCKDYKDMVECPRGADCTSKHFTYSEELIFYRYNKLPEHAGDAKVVGAIFAGAKRKNGEKLRVGVCWTWRRGETCTKENCSLLHPAEEDRDKYPFEISHKICYKWRVGRCVNTDCIYKHPDTRLKVCQAFIKKLSCPRDTECSSLHMTRLEEKTFYRTGAMPTHQGDPMITSADDAAKSYYGKTGSKQTGRVSWFEV